MGNVCDRRHTAGTKFPQNPTLLPPGTQGNFGRTVLRGFGAAQADVVFQRRFALRKQLGLRFLVEFFNIFNYPYLGNPSNNLTDPLFGHRRRCWRVS